MAFRAGWFMKSVVGGARWHRGPVEQRRVASSCSGSPAACLAALSFAANTGSLAGTVLDNGGAPLPGVTVSTSSDALIGGPQTAVTGASGEFAFHLLLVGDYTIEAVLPGFRPQAGDVRVQADATASVTFRMVPEAFDAEIEVTAEVPVVDTSQVSSREAWDQEFLAHALIGTANRSYQAVLGQAAGVTGGNNPYVLGSTYSENAYLVDGMNTTDPATGTWATTMNIDAVQELNFQTGGFEAEFGRASGGIVNLVTKSGGNELAGSLDVRIATRASPSRATTTTATRSSSTTPKPRPPSAARSCATGCGSSARSSTRTARPRIASPTSRSSAGAGSSWAS